MKHRFRYWLLASQLFLPAMPVHADTPASTGDTVRVTQLWYLEKETGTDASKMRYLISDRYIRIDAGHAKDDYVLYDNHNHTIYNINHEDHTLMVIHPRDWQAPAFAFKHHNTHQSLDKAPKIAQKTVISYKATAGGKMCANIQLLPDLFAREQQLFQAYQKVLSGQSVASLERTPKEFRTPCFLTDEVYNGGDYYQLGLPVNEWHARGYTRLLQDFGSANVSVKLFTLPKGYSEYEPLGN